MYEHNLEVNVNKTMLFGISWKSSAQILIMGSFFLFMAVLAIVLEPADIGIYGMAESVIQFLILLMVLGIDFAIIQQTNITDTILSTVFWLGLGLGVILCIICITTAPLFSDYFQEDQVTLILSMLSLTFIFRSLSVVHRGILERQLAFRKVALIDIGANIIAALLGIVAAFIRRDFWALVIFSLARNCFIAVGFLSFSKWKPRMVFDLQASKDCIKFSANLMIYDILYFITKRSDVFIIGRLLGPNQLGYYLMAYQLVFRPTERLIAAIKSTLYPILATLQTDLYRLRETYTNMIYVVFLFLSPLITTAAIISPVIFEQLGEKWQASIPIFMVWCYGAVHALLISQTSLLFLSTGRPDLHWKYQVITMFIVVGSLLVGITLNNELGAAVGINISQTLLSALLIKLGFAQVDLKVTHFFSHFKFQFATLVSATIFGIVTHRLINSWEIHPYIHIVIVAVLTLLFYFVLVFSIDQNAKKFLQDGLKWLASRSQA